MPGWLRDDERNPAEYRKKWGIPNWRNDEEYPKTLTDKLWRWEFLRRRDDYRKDWLKWESASARGRVRMSELCEKYGFWDVQLHNPSVSEPRLLPFGRILRQPSKEHMVLLPGVVWTSLSEDRRLVLLPNQALVIFELNKEISPQIRAVGRRLQTVQRATQKTIEKTKLPRKNFALYLRALDAEAAGITYKEFYTTVYPKHRIRTHRARGQEIFEAAHTLQTRITSA